MMEFTEEVKVLADQNTTYQPQLQALKESDILLPALDMIRKADEMSKDVFFTTYFFVFLWVL